MDGPLSIEELVISTVWTGSLYGLRLALILTLILVFGVVVYVGTATPVALPLILLFSSSLSSSLSLLSPLSEFLLLWRLMLFPKITHMIMAKIIKVAIIPKFLNSSSELSLFFSSNWLSSEGFGLPLALFVFTISSFVQSSREDLHFELFILHKSVTP